MGDVTIRTMLSTDVPAITAAFGAMGWHKPAELYARYLAEQRDGHRLCLVAFVADAFAGYVTVMWQSTYPPLAQRGIPEITDLNVMDTFQRRGVASRLLDQAEQEVANRAHGSPTASVTTTTVGIAVGLHPGYNAAQRLYVTRGYVPDGRGVTYRERYVQEGETVPFDDDLVLHLTKDVQVP